MGIQKRALHALGMAWLAYKLCVKRAEQTSVCHIQTNRTTFPRKSHVKTTLICLLTCYYRLNTFEFLKFPNANKHN